MTAPASDTITPERVALEIAKALNLGLDSIDVITSIVSKYLPASGAMSVKEFAAMVNVHPETIRRMISDGTIASSAYHAIGRKGKRVQYKINPAAALAAMRRAPNHKASTAPLPRSRPARRHLGPLPILAKQKPHP